MLLLLNKEASLTFEDMAFFISVVCVEKQVNFFL